MIKSIVYISEELSMVTKKCLQYNAQKSLDEIIVIQSEMMCSLHIGENK